MSVIVSSAAILALSILLFAIAGVLASMLVFIVVCEIRGHVSPLMAVAFSAKK